MAFRLLYGIELQIGLDFRKGVICNHMPAEEGMIKL